MSFIEHLHGLAKLEENTGKKIAFSTSADKIQAMQYKIEQLKKENEEFKDFLNLIADESKPWSMQDLKSLL